MNQKMINERTLKKHFTIIISAALILALSGCLERKVIEDNNVVPLTPVPGISGQVEISPEEAQKDASEPFSSINNPEDETLQEEITGQKEHEAPAETPGKVEVYYFWGDGCPMCTTQGKFLDEIQEKFPKIDIKRFETWRNRENYQIFLKVADAYGFSPRGVPTTFIGHRHWVGFSSAYGSQMEQMIIGCIEDGCKGPGEITGLY